jgi:hypothetical protein
MQIPARWPVVIKQGRVSTRRTVHQNPVLHVFRDFGSPFPERELLKSIRDNRITVPNVAGPRASEEPEVGAFVRVVLDSDGGLVPARKRPITDSRSSKAFCLPGRL